MNRLDNLLQRLPPIYSATPESLLGQILALLAQAMAAFDEDTNRVQRSHWVDTAYDRDDLARLGALFGVVIAPWEPEALYRRRLKATVAARLEGAVTRSTLERAVLRILSGALEALGLR